MQNLFENVADEYEGKMFQYPLVVGKTWEDNWNSTNKTTLEGYEEVNIALGTFPAGLKHKTVLTGAHIGSELEKALVNGTRYLWFAKGVGIVKMRYEHSNGVVTDNPPTESEVVVRITKQAETTKLQRAILAGILGKK